MTSDHSTPSSEDLPSPECHRQKCRDRYTSRLQPLVPFLWDLVLLTVSQSVGRADRFVDEHIPDTFCGSRTSGKGRDRLTCLINVRDYRSFINL